MDFERNSKFFTEKKNIVMLIVGLAIIVLGIAAALIFGYDAMFICGVVILIGAIIIFSVFSFKVKPDELDEQADYYAAAFEREYTEKFLPESPFKKQVGAIEEKKPVPIYFHGYCLDDGTQIKKGSDGTYRSTLYYHVGIMIDKYRICVGKKIMSFVDPEHNETYMESLKYGTLKNAELVLAKDGEHADAKKYSYLKFYNNNGTEIVSVIVNTDAESDKLLDNINNAIKKYYSLQQHD